MSHLLVRGPGRLQRGMSLVIGLLFLALLSLLALAGMGVSTLEERMAGNSQDYTLAFNAAEAALRDCESVLQGAALPPFNNSNGMYQMNEYTSDVWTAPNMARVYVTTPAGAAAPPRCIIEELPPQAGSDGNDSLAANKPLADAGIYRVTARGVGAQPGTVVMLQTIYVR